MDEIEELFDGLAVIFPEFSHCVAGIVIRAGGEHIVCYDYEKVIATLAKDMPDEGDAVEHFYFNVLGSYLGEHTPCFLMKAPNHDIPDV